MKTNRSILYQAALLALAGATSWMIPAAQADSHVSVGVSVGVPLPNGYASVYVGPNHYYYHHGVFYHPGPHGYYVVHAPYGCVVPVLPPHYVSAYYGGVPYYTYGGVYYQSAPGGYVVVNPPSTVAMSAPVSTTTTTVAAAPVAPAKEDQYQSVWSGDVEYMFKDGQFFKRTSDGLVWAPTPLGAITKAIPADAHSVWYQDVEYFESDEVCFRKTPNGYKVVEAPWKKDEPPAPAAK
jgi:hypothetical protein